MNIFQHFMLYFGLSTIVGVPLLSSFQVTQIKGSTWGEWASSLGTTLGPATGIFIIVSAITYILMKPLIKAIKESEKRELTNEEKNNAKKVLSKVNLLSRISILCGYLLGNGTTIVIKTLTGKVNYNITDLIIIAILIILYGLMAVEYAVTCFNEMIRKELTKLKITSTDEIKTNNFSVTIGKSIILITIFISWHVFCSGYSAIRHGWTMNTFFSKAGISLLIACITSFPLTILVLIQLYKRFSVTIKQIRALRLEGNLKTRLYIGTFDDFGVVMSEMNMLMEFLQTILSKLKHENTIVDTDADELSQVTENSSSGISQIVSSFQNMNIENQKKDALLETAKQNIAKLNEDAAKVTNFMEAQSSAEEKNAASISEMVNNFNSMSEMISKAQELSRSLAQESIEGNAKVSKTQAAINEISEKSRKMNEMIGAIQKVATQTNLLAMNAAIEAAHAGEAGKGFSVVADEIRKLSISTQKSAKDIADIITEVSESMAIGTNDMNDTSVAFNKIKDGIQEQNGLVEEISRTVSNQSEGANNILTSTNHIFQQINDVNELIKSQANYTKEIKNGIDDIVELSEKVNVSMAESENVIREFSNSFATVQNKTEQNKESVKSIIEELKKFEL